MVDLRNILSRGVGQSLDAYKPEHPTKDDLDMLVGIHPTKATEQDKHKIVDKFWEWMEGVSDEHRSIGLSLSAIINNASSSLLVAYQRLSVDSTGISTTEVTDDTIVTKSETDIEFDWLDSRRLNIVMLGPGDSVRPMRVIFDSDRNLEDSGNYAGTVFPTTSVKLQRMNWDGSDWVGIAWDDGWTLDMWQVMPAVLRELA